MLLFVGRFDHLMLDFGDVRFIIAAVITENITAGTFFTVTIIAGEMLLLLLLLTCGSCCCCCSCCCCLKTNRLSIWCVENIQFTIFFFTFGVSHIRR